MQNAAIAEEAEHFTDAGNAQRLIRLHGDRIRYVYEHSRWLAWNGKQWAPDATGAVERYAKDTVRKMYAEASAIEHEDERKKAVNHALQSEGVARLDAMVRTARSDEAIVIRASDLDADPWMLNVQNGTLDLRTGELLPHDSAAMHSKITSASYDPAAQGGRWEAFLLEVLPDPDVRRFVQKLVGYSLSGEIGENVLPFPYGSGANGKSVFLSVVREVLGDYGTEAAPDLLVEKRFSGVPTDVADLRGYRFVTTTEIEGGRRMASDVMKRITGESKLKARRMRQDFESFDNVTTLWMAANDRPQVDGLDEAIWRRIRLIPFTVTIAADNRDPFLTQTLLEEQEAILAWAVEGCLAWQREGLKPPEAVMAATDSYREESNPLADWFEAECELDPDAIIPAAQLRETYERWTVAFRVKKIPRGTKWTQGLERLGCSQPENPVKIDGKTTRVWQGVRLRKRPADGGLSL